MGCKDKNQHSSSRLALSTFSSASSRFGPPIPLAAIYHDFIEQQHSTYTELIPEEEKVLKQKDERRIRALL
jgi:hypothetical protein